MAMESAKSTSSTVAQAIKNRYYDELFLKIAESKLVHKQLGQKNRQIPRGEGGYGTGGGNGVVFWTRWSNLPLVSVGQGEGVPTTAVSMTAVNVTGSTGQYDAAVSISDILAYTSFGDVMKAAIERLAYNAGLSIDTVVRAAIDTEGTQVNGSSVAYWSAVPAAAYLTITDIRRAVRRLEMADAMQLADGNWVSVIHPAAVYDLRGDTTTGGWIDANKYTEPNANKLLTGEIGKLLGVRFLETSNAATRGSSYATESAVVASATIFVTSVFGQDAFGVTDLQALKTYVKGFGSAGSADPTDKVATAGWKCTFGATALNSAFFVNINHTVTSTA